MIVGMAVPRGQLAAPERPYELVSAGFGLFARASSFVIANTVVNLVELVTRAGFLVRQKDARAPPELATQYPAEGELELAA